MSETDLGGMGYGPAGARCAIHPDQLATQTCTRCGSFMCPTCSEGGAQTMCPSCLQRLGMESRFPLNRENWNFSALWDYCFEIFKREWVMLSVATLIFFGIVFAMNFVTSMFSTLGGAAAKGSTSFMIVSTVISTVMQQVVSGVMGLGLMRLILDVLEGQKPDIGRMFSRFSRVGTYLLAMLIIVLVVAIPLAILGGIVAGIGAASGFESGAWIAVAVVAGVLALIPLIYYSMPLYLLTAEISYSEASAMQAIRNCYAYGRNERLSIFGVGIVAGLVTMAGVLACCVGMLPATGLAYMLIGGLYLSLRNGANLRDEGED